ncbi:MAG TPA: iron-containing alcohol dehydrogenase [Chloroflexota bacterium]|nr:iron-containing alcohol dehydrogenase [Chloroflexota bacterium]
MDIASSVPQGQYVFTEMDLVAFGPGSAERLRTEVERLNAERALLVTTGSLAAGSGAIDRVRRLLGDRLAGEFAGVRQHAPASGVVSLVTEARRLEADLFVSLGGGSVIDTAKAATLALARDTGTFLQHVALPTTLSASEFSPLFGVTDDETRIKTGGSSPFVVPQVVILDAELVRETPDWLWLASGVRALDHAVETIYAADHQPVTDATSAEAIRLLFEHLPESVGEGDLVAARHQCQMAAWLSFFGVSNITLGLSHVLGRELGSRYGIAHGHTSAILLPAVMASLLPETAERQELIARAAGRSQAAEAGPAVYELVRALGLPQRLRDVGVPRDDLAGLAAGRGRVLRILEATW